MAQATPTTARYYRSVRTVTGWTIVFMVLLRVAVGWHFFYEGWWKLTSGGKFSSTPYLMASVGPFKDVFHWMVDDMDGTRKRLVKDEYLYAKLDERFNAIVKFYGNQPQDEKLVADLTARQAKGERLSADDQGRLDRELKRLTQGQIDSLKAFVERKKHGVTDDKTAESLFNNDALFAKTHTAAGEYVDPKAPGKTDQVTIVTVSARPEKRAEIIKEIEAIVADLDRAVLAGVNDPLLGKDAPGGQKDKAASVPAATIVPAGTGADDVSWINRAYVEKLLDDRYDTLKKHYGLTESVQHQSKYGWRYRERKKCAARYCNQRKCIHHDKNNVDAILNDPDFQKALEDYKALLIQIDKEEKEGRTAYDDERVQFNTTKAGKLRAALLARVEGPLGDVDLQKIQGFSEYLGPIKDVTPAQLSVGPIATAREMAFPGSLFKKAGFELPKQTLTYWQDIGMMLGLTVIGACLVLGLFTRLAALGGACMLAMFYLAMPPFPGVHVPENAAEGHYLFVNKNLIEMIAMLMFAFSGVGRWFGIDGILHAVFGRRAEAAEASAPAAGIGANQGRVYIPELRTRDGSRA